MDGPRTIGVPFTTESRCLLVPPARPVAGVAPPLLVVLHGQGQSGLRQHRWMEGAVPPHFAAAFPDGFHRHEVRKPDRPARIGHAWYLFSADRPAFLASLADAEGTLWRLVDTAVVELGADAGRVWLAGFSQGAYLVNYAALSHPDRVAGWVAQAGNVRADYVQGGLPMLDGKPVLLQYGREDASLPDGTSEACRELLAAQGAEVELSLHDAGHAIVPAMADEIRGWLTAHDPPDAPA